MVVLAHYGAAPEALTLGLPVLIFGAFVVAERRARRRDRERAAGTPTPTLPPPP